MSLGLSSSTVVRHMASNSRMVVLSITPISARSVAALWTERMIGLLYFCLAITFYLDPSARLDGAGHACGIRRQDSRRKLPHGRSLVARDIVLLALGEAMQK